MSTYRTHVGDCRALLPHVPAGSVDMILCDLPYATTQGGTGAPLPFDALWTEYVRVLKPSGAVVLTSARPFASDLAAGRPNLYRYLWQGASKPLSLMTYLIRTYSNPGELVLDNTMGSGTTGVAAMRCGRNFLGMEQNPEYAAIAEARIFQEMCLAYARKS